tara:strand:+ start:1260 stop:1880 length:621 start_codon:yes stop_codon:yes gene_type:complete
MSTKRKMQAKNAESRYSSKSYQPSPYDHLLWGAINKNTEHRHIYTHKDVGQESYASTEVTINATAASNTDGTISQPAGTILKRLEIIPQSTITTAGAAGDDLDFSLGNVVGGGQYLAVQALLDDGGAAVSALKGRILPVIDNFGGQAVNAFNDAPYFGPATSEASTIQATTYTATKRKLHFRFTPLANDLAATGKVTLVAHFVKTY